MITRVSERTGVQVASHPTSISEAEAIVMEVIWATNPIPTEDIVAALEPHGKWQEATVKTLLNRLLKKGALKARKDGRRYLYSPVLKRDQWLAAEPLELQTKIAVAPTQASSALPTVRQICGQERVLHLGPSCRTYEHPLVDPQFRHL